MSENNLEQRLRKHYRQHYASPSAPEVVWARVQPDLDIPGEVTPRFTRRARWLSALTGFLIASKQDAFSQSQEDAHFTQNAQGESEKPRPIQARRPLRGRLRHTLEVAIAVLMVASLVLGWFAVTRWRSAQGNGPALYTYISQPGEYVYDLNWTPDGKHLMFVIYTQATNHYSYMIWDTATGKARQTLAIGLPAAFIGSDILDSSDGHYALIRTGDAAKHLWVLELANVLTGQTKLIYQGTPQGQNASSDTTAAAFSADSKYVAFIGADERVHIWDIAAGKMIQTTDPLVTSGTVGSQWFTWSLDGKRIMVKSDGLKSRLQVWSVQTGHTLLNIAETPSISFFSWAPELGNLGGLSLDGTRILTFNGQTGVIVERESSTLKVLHTFSVRVTPLPGGARANGEPLWVANGTRIFFQEGQAVYLWDGATNKLISTISLQDDPESNVSITLVGKYITLWKRGNLVEIWDIVTGTKVRTIAPTITVQGQDGGSTSSDGRYLLLNDYNGNGQIYSVLTGRLIMNYQGDNALLPPDARYVATRSSYSQQSIVQILSMP